MSETGGYGNRALPTIMDTSVQSSTTRSKFFKSSADEKFMTRAERFEEFEKKTKKVYLRETTQNLENEVSCLCVVQIGGVPYNFEIYLYPSAEDRCERVAIFSDKRITKGIEVVYASKSYWLEAGKVHELLNSTSVLAMDECQKAAGFIAAKKGAIPEYIGDKLLDFGKGEHPYRVFTVGMDYLIMNLLNGAIFMVQSDNMPDMIEVEDHFYVKEILFEKEKGKDDWKRF